MSVAANYCINPNIKALCSPQIYQHQVPDFLGSCLISRLPDSVVMENEITAPSPDEFTANSGI